MDILDLTAALRNISHNGQSFHVEERLQLEMGVQDLLANSAETDFEELLFWGKVCGLNKDYYICMGL